MRKRVRRLGVVIVLVASALVLAEVFARFVVGLGNPPLFEASVDYGYRFRPNQDIQRFGNRIFFNAYGLRSEPMDFEPVAGTIRVLCIGDSITYGGVLTDQKETYPYQLEDILNASSSLRFKVLNASAPGWSIGNEEAYLYHHGIYNSQIVVLQIDSHDLFKQKRSYKVVGQLANYPNRKPIFALQEIFCRYFPRYLPILELKEELTEENLTLEEILSRNFKSLVSIDNFVNKKGGKLIVVFVALPYSSESNFTLLKFEEQKFLRKFKELNITLINMERNFLEAGDGKLFRDGIHPNPAGNRVMAETVAEFILNRFKDKLED